jgi:hypothetical protein
VTRRLGAAALVLAGCVAAAPPPAAADANAGAALVAANGCAGCHGATLHGGSGPNLVGVEGRLAPARIAAAIAQPVAPMPKFPFSPAQIADIVAYLSSLDSATRPSATLRFTKPLSAVLTVRVPGPPPAHVTAVPAMQMGDGEMGGSTVTLRPSGNGHLWHGTLVFSMSGAWRVDVIYDGHHLVVPVNVAGSQ